MVKMKYYLDTSIINFYLSSGYETGDITRKVIKEIMNSGEIYISDVVIREIYRCSEPKRTKLIEVVNYINPVVLEVNIESMDLAERYIIEKVIPEKYFDDALHIAVATVNEIDVLLSWNFEHIVKLKTKRIINGINKIVGYKEIEICSPQEV